jgi:hypothetical protein
MILTLTQLHSLEEVYARLAAEDDNSIQENINSTLIRESISSRVNCIGVIKLIFKAFEENEPKMLTQV